MFSNIYTMINPSLFDKSIIRLPLLPTKFSFSIEELNSILQNREFREALYIASMSLYKALSKTNFILQQNANHKLINSVLKYALRSSNRCTPFGTLASLSTTSWSAESSFDIGSKHVIKELKFSHKFLIQIVNHIHQDKQSSRILRFRTNRTIKINKSNISYIESTLNPNLKISQQYVEIKDDIFLVELIQSLQKWTKFDDISKLILSRNKEFGKEEVNHYLFDLLESNILVSELNPNYTGGSFFKVLLDKLNTSKSESLIIKSIYTVLKNCDRIIVNINESRCPISNYQQILDMIASLNLEIPETDIFHIDSYVSTKKTISSSHNIKQKLNESLAFLDHTFGDTYHIKEYADFKKAFYKRYEMKSVPLMLAIDPEKGIGYPASENKIQNNIIKGVAKSRPTSNSANYRIQKRYTDIYRSLSQKGTASEIMLDAINFDKYEASAHPYPKTSSVFYQIYFDETSNSHKIFIKNHLNHSGSTLISRFNDPAIKDILREITKIENNTNEDTIVAELVHCPDLRYGDVVNRNVTRNYEIPISVNSIPSKSKTAIDITDLYLKYDQKTNSLNVLSKKLGKQIEIYHSSAYNARLSSNPIYRFLFDYQFQSKKLGVSWDFSSTKSIINYLPRISYKDTIISREKWFLHKNEIDSLLNNNLSIESWLKRYHIDQIFTLVEGDNEIIIDTNNLHSIELFKDLVRSKTSITICETLEYKLKPVLQEIDGQRFNSEFISFYKYPSPSDININKPIIKDFKIKREYMPMDEWIYFIIHCGINSANEVLSSIHTSLLEGNFPLNYFFVRYYDESGFHLRFRIRCTQPTIKLDIYNSIHKTLETHVTNNVVWKYSVDSYVRELERYGEKVSMELSEEIFILDSLYTVQFIKSIDSLSYSHQHLKYACLSIDCYLDLVNFDLQEKHDFCNRRSENMGHEFGLEHKFVKISIDSKYRNIKNDIFQAFRSKDKHWDQRIIKFKQLTKNHKIEQFLDSYIHMSINRIFSTDQRTSEFVLFYFLKKYYLTTLKLSEKSQLNCS